MGESVTPIGDAVPRNVPARRRVAVAFGSFAIGLVLARHVLHVPSMWWFIACGAMVAAAAIGRGWACRVALAAAVTLAAAGWYSYRIDELPHDSLAHVLHDVDPNQGMILSVHGIALAAPERVDPPSDIFAKFRHERTSWRFVVDVREVSAGEQDVPSSGSLWVRVSTDEQPSVHAGERVHLTGVARPISPPLNPGQIDARPAAGQSGFVGSLSLSSAQLVQEWHGDDRALDAIFVGFLRARGFALARARHVLDEAFGAGSSSEERALVSGLLLGDIDDASGRSVYDAFTRLGLAHVLSISGFHLAVLASMTLFLIRLTGDRGWVEPVLVGVIVVGYTLMLPPQSPILRSAAMVLMMLLAEAFGRRYDRLTILMWIAILLLVWHPADLWNLGYQLSVGLTSLLMWLGDAWHTRLFLPPVRSDLPAREGIGQVVWRHAKAAWSTAILCFGASVPLVLYRTGVLSLLGIVATLVVTPIVIVVLWVGYVLLFAGSIIPGLAKHAGGLLGAAAHAAVVATQKLDSVPMSSIRLPTVSLTWTLVATVVLLALYRTGRRVQARWWGCVAALVLWLSIEWWVGLGLRRGVSLRMDSLAVGDGSCHILRSGKDTLVWDCGTLSGGLDSTRLRRAFRSLGIWRASTAVVTHPDIDHFGSLPDVVPILGIRTVFLCERFVRQAADEPEGAAAVFVREMERLNVRLRVVAAGDAFEFGDSSLEFLSPPSGASWSRDNEHSLVARLRVPTTSERAREVLLTGDLQYEGLRWVAQQHPDLHADVLEVPHHGSALPESIMWVHGLEPGVAVQSTGPSRAGDPRWASLRRSTAWYTTCVDGAAWVEVGHDGTIRSGSLRQAAVGH